MPLTILFIDDEPFYAGNYVQALEKDGFKVVLKDSADGGLEHVRCHATELDLIVLDFMMPTPSGVSSVDTMDGLATGRWFLRQIRDQIEGCHLPVLILTNRAPEGIIHLVKEDVLLDSKLFHVRQKMQTPSFSLPRLAKQMISR